ncbi:MAG: transporter substrate-binding domain-containing protein [Desulfamplus sp.]|nr:transporter substrate-binding domain-containing protein [Desulfamplus sp.]
MRKSIFMRKNKFIALCLACLSVFIIAKNSWAKDTVMWGHNCIPPLYVCDGDGDKVTGVAADIENIIFENLKEYEHQRLSSNVERLIDNLKTQDMFFCNVAMAKNPEREKFAYFSIPAAIVPPIHIFIRKDDHAIFGGADIVSLENSLKNTKLKFGYPASRSFGKEIDAIIKTYVNEPNVSASYSSAAADQPMNLLINKRIDYTIGGYFALKIAAKKQGIEDKILPLKVSENQDYLVLYVVAPKNDWGKTIIDKINTILKKEIPTQQYFDLFKPFYDDKTKDDFKKQYDELLIKPTSK